VSDAIRTPTDSISMPAFPGEHVMAKWDGIELVQILGTSPMAQRAVAEQVARRALKDTPFHTPAYALAETEVDTRVFIARRSGVAIGMNVMRPRARWAWWSWDDWDAERRPSTGVAPMVAWTVESIWTHPAAQQHGLAQRILEEVSRLIGVPISSLGWNRPFTPSGEAFVRRNCPEGFWVPD
jgi:hypothetical protein